MAKINYEIGRSYCIYEIAGLIMIIWVWEAGTVECTEK